MNSENYQVITPISETELEQMTMSFSNINVNNRNKDKTKKFANSLLNTSNDKKIFFKRFITHSSRNALIYAPTQVGKSAATVEFIETCFYNGVPVIVSTANKCDQQEQLFNRINLNLGIDNVVLVKASDKTFTKTITKCVKDKFNNFVIFCLDNSSQIEKVTNLLCILYTKHGFTSDKIAIIHDEADIITKDTNINTSNENQPVSHQKWLELHNLINTKMTKLNLKRIFITATPENCVMLYDITCPDVMRLEIPHYYIGYDKVKYIDISEKNIESILKFEVRRIKTNKTFEAILHCIERKIKNGQEEILQNLASKLLCVVNTYNGNGICLYMPTKELSDKFQTLLTTENLSYIHDNLYFNIKQLTIRKFYTMVKQIGENCVVTIGKDLICRGISYVGEDTIEPITATTMIYKPGSTMYNVGISQTIGRITGCAMPNLERRLYCTKDIYNNYIAYNQNQEKYINIFNQKFDGQTTKEVIDQATFEKTSRSIDKPALKLKMNTEEPEESEQLSPNDSDEIIDGVYVRNIKKWMNSSLTSTISNKDSVVGSILTYLYYNDSKITPEELSSKIGYHETLDKFLSNINSGKSPKSNYGKLWNFRLGEITLNKKIRKYIDENII